MQKEFSNFLSFAHFLSDKTRDELNNNYMNEKLLVTNKNINEKKELVTNIDIKIEKRIRTLITKHYPKHNIIGEEGNTKKTSSDYTWIIDPIDGTKAFIAGIPVFGFLIALNYKSKNILGMVDIPVLKERFWNADKNAYRNGVIIKTKKCKYLSKAILASTEPSRFSNYKYMNEKLFAKFNFIRWGTDVMGYLRCAQGFIDVVIERNIKIWDVAALVPIIKSSGGCISTWDGHEVGHNDTGCASGDKELHNCLLKYLQKMI